MDVTTTRQANFVSLFRRFREERAAEPDRGMLKKFAEFLDLSERYLSHVRCGRKPIGHATARAIEDAHKLPHGWMDVEHGDMEPRNVGERLFLATALALYRTAPGHAQNEMIEILTRRLGGPPSKGLPGAGAAPESPDGTN